MKTVITILVVLFTGFMACDTPEPATGNQGDTTTINSNRPTDTTMNSGTDTTMRRDSIPQ